MKTTRNLFFITLLLFVLASISCQKDPPATTTEETLTVVTSPVTTNNHVEAPAPGPTFPLTVTITSKMPANGVKISVTARQDGSTATFYTETRNSTIASNTFTITGTPKTVVCVTDITVTSLSKSTNTFTGSYRYSSK